MNYIKAAVLASIVLTFLVLAAPAAAESQKYRATFVEIGGDTGTGSSCGSGTISGLGHVANQCIEFDACGINCHERTISFGDGSTLFIEESVVHVITHGNSAGFLEIADDHGGHRPLRGGDGQWYWRGRSQLGCRDHRVGHHHARLTIH